MNRGFVTKSPTAARSGELDRAVGERELLARAPTRPHVVDLHQPAHADDLALFETVPGVLARNEDRRAVELGRRRGRPVSGRSRRCRCPIPSRPARGTDRSPSRTAFPGCRGAAPARRRRCPGCTPCAGSRPRRRSRRSRRPAGATSGRCNASAQRRAGRELFAHLRREEGALVVVGAARAVGLAEQRRAIGSVRMPVHSSIGKTSFSFQVPVRLFRRVRRCAARCRNCRSIDIGRDVGRELHQLALRGNRARRHDR